MKWFDAVALHQLLDWNSQNRSNFSPVETKKQSFAQLDAETQRDFKSFVHEARIVWDRCLTGLDNPLTWQVRNEMDKASADAGDVEVRGIDGTRRFYSAELEESRKVIGDLLDRLPAVAQYVSGEYGKDFNFQAVAMQQPAYPCWALVVAMKMVYTLGMAIGRVREIADREFWETLPGGLPYYVVENDEVV